MADNRDIPAFPCATGSDGDVAFGGMTLYQWYAGQALVGLISCLSSKLTQRQLAEQREILGHPANRTDWTVAKCAHDYAEAMIREEALRQREAKP